MKGRKPKPTQLKVITGNPGKRPLPEHEPKVKAASLRAPTHLSTSAKMHWRLVSKQLDDAGILTALDVDALCLYCEAFARWKEANDNVAKFGMVIKTPNGYPAPSPYLSISNKAFEQMKAIACEFGMTPSSRTRVKQSFEPQRPNKFAELD